MCCSALKAPPLRWINSAPTDQRLDEHVTPKSETGNLEQNKLEVIHENKNLSPVGYFRLMQVV